MNLQFCTRLVRPYTNLSEVSCLSCISSSTGNSLQSSVYKLYIVQDQQLAFATAPASTKVFVLLTTTGLHYSSDSFPIIFTEIPIGLSVCLCVSSTNTNSASFIGNIASSTSSYLLILLSNIICSAPAVGRFKHPYSQLQDQQKKKKKKQ